MRTAIVGGGPSGLYLSILLKKLDPSHEVTVYERNAPDDTFGFGVVFSDETLSSFEAADRATYDEITRRFARWAEIDVHYRGAVLTSGGHGFSALARVGLLHNLQRRAAGLDVDLRFHTEVDGSGLEDEFDLVVAADGVNSTLRRRHADAFGPSLDRRKAKYAWFGTDLVFDAFKFFIKETAHGVVQVHGYPYSDGMSTFIVETTPRAWRGLGLDRASEEESLAICEDLFVDVLDGHRLIPNRSLWIDFVTVRNATWRHGNVVLLGDAAHTAHFSIGSGTKLAMEDAIGLAGAVKETPGDVGAALAAYEAERKPIVESTQRAAQGSLEWFEGIERYMGQEPRIFAFNLLTRSRRITYTELQLRHAPHPAPRGSAPAPRGSSPGSTSGPPRGPRRCSRRSGCAASSSRTASS